MTDDIVRRGWQRVLDFVHRREGWLVVGLFLVLVIGGLIEFSISKGWKSSAGTDNPPNATTFISTLIVIYTVFLTVYGAILPQLVDTERKRGHPWYWFMALLTLVAVGVDLYRIINSLDDLYRTTNLALTPDKIDDASYEFSRYWFLLNVVVLILLLFTLSIQRRDDRGEARFRGTVTFDRAEFPGTVTFDRAKFTGSTVTFNEAKFAGKVTFNEAKFTADDPTRNSAQFRGFTPPETAGAGGPP